MRENQKKADSVGIPVAVIRRLPLYHRFLTDLRKKEVERVSSRELAAKMKITASQLRQDLSWFGSFGQQGYGYRVDDLLAEVNRILGLDETNSMVLIGAGHLGKALINYEGFQRRGFLLTAIFDHDPRIIGIKINDHVVKDVAELPGFLRDHPTEIGIITVPESVAQEVADLLVKGGVKGIWNFAPVSLRVPEDVCVEHVHIGESLMVLSFKIRQKTCSGSGEDKEEF